MAHNRLSRLNDGMSALTMGAPLTGLFGPQDAPEPTAYGLAFLIVAVRVKFWIDDMDFFENPSKGGARSDRTFRIGMLLALASWTLFIVAGVTVHTPAASGAFLFAALLASHLWLAVELAGPKRYARTCGDERSWNLINVFYLLFAALLALSPFAQDLARDGLAIAMPLAVVQWIAIGALAITLAVDIMKANWLQSARCRLAPAEPQSNPRVDSPG